MRWGGRRRQPTEKGRGVAAVDRARTEVRRMQRRPTALRGGGETGGGIAFPGRRLRKRSGIRLSERRGDHRPAMRED